MPKPIVDRIPGRFLPLAALVAGRPDAAAAHLRGGVDVETEQADLRAEIDELRAEVSQLREELSFALEFVDRLGSAPREVS